MEGTLREMGTGVSYKGLSYEAANHRRAKVPTINRPWKGDIVIMLRMV